MKSFLKCLRRQQFYRNFLIDLFLCITGPPVSTCLALIPRDPIEFVELKLDSESLHVTIQAHESHSAWFSQPDPAFLRFTFTVPTNARLALLGRKNEPPTLTAYHMLEVISQDKSQKLYKRDAQVGLSLQNTL